MSMLKCRHSPHGTLLREAGALAYTEGSTTILQQHDEYVGCGKQDS